MRSGPRESSNCSAVSEGNQLRPAAAPGTPGGRKTATEPPEGVRSCCHLDFGLLVSRTVRIHFLSLKPLSVWDFVLAAPGHNAVTVFQVPSSPRHLWSLRTTCLRL